jgi:predicted membrane GTPase involved in stress response
LWRQSWQVGIVVHVALNRLFCRIIGMVTSVRQSTGEELERLVPSRLPEPGASAGVLRNDECVEVTASAVRLRKTVLDAGERFRERARAA